MLEEVLGFILRVIKIIFVEFLFEFIEAMFRCIRKLFRLFKGKRNTNGVQ
jgi:hypothetical protein